MLLQYLSHTQYIGASNFVYLSAVTIV